MKRKKQIIFLLRVIIAIPLLILYTGVELLVELILDVELVVLIKEGGIIIKKVVNVLINKTLEIAEFIVTVILPAITFGVVVVNTYQIFSGTAVNNEMYAMCWILMVLYIVLFFLSLYISEKERNRELLEQIDLEEIEN